MMNVVDAFEMIKGEGLDLTSEPRLQRALSAIIIRAYKEGAGAEFFSRGNVTSNVWLAVQVLVGAGEDGIPGAETARKVLDFIEDARLFSNGVLRRVK